MELFHEKVGTPLDVKPYTVNRFLAGTAGNQPFYQMCTMPFDSKEAFNEAMPSPVMPEVAADANRISIGCTNNLSLKIKYADRNRSIYNWQSAYSYVKFHLVSSCWKSTLSSTLAQFF